MKKLLSMLLILALAMSAMPFALAEGLEPLTTDEITLRYACWGQAEAGEPEVLQALIAQFEEAHPNIHVEFVPIDQGTWDAGLTNLASQGQLPDVFWVFSVSAAVSNEWALDLTEFYEKDPDAQELYPTMVSSSKIGGKNYSYPAVLFPHMVFMNKTLFDKYNVDLPSTDWTWDDYFDLAEELSHPEEFYFGVSNPLYVDLFPAAINGNQGKFGWDGEAYHFDDAWVEAVETRAEVINNKICEWMSAEDKEAVLGDPGAWPPGKGRTAMHIDWPWTMAMFNTTVKEETGCEFVYYPLPMGEGKGELAIVDNGIIAASTEHPREAWELAKWMSWGPMAALKRQETYRSLGYPVSRMPVVSTPEVWQDLVDNADDTIKGFYEAVLTRGVNFVPSNWPVCPGWGEIEAYYNSNDIDGKILRGELSAADVAAELEEVANRGRDNYLASIAE
ncbi:MAG: extracellular solute-binding protein [Clostridia bacterium]|nr:extracellular solute-binding protein [Clostridia bacterium]MBR0217590.1 extracellular solute-binding protein [Clostridia bacterium]MBR0226728.1 extracellular solute-binding protein [Clostridia bacterium]